MPGLLWWIQIVGGALSIILVSGAIIAGIYSTARETPVFWRRLTGAKPIEDKFEEKFEELRRDHSLSQELQLQQAESFNELSIAVCEEHDVPEENRPPKMDIDAIRIELMGRENMDFTTEGD